MNRCDLINLIVERALDGIERLTPAERADIYEGISLVLRAVHIDRAEAAMHAARQIREAESAQLHFKALFRQ